MAARFEELAWRDTPLGEISLRRRIEPTVNREVYEVRLGDEYLMSSLFTVAERALASLALARLTGPELDVCVGGLGLGCTAVTALADPRVRELIVIEALTEVIDWHRQSLLPEAVGLAVDLRTRLVNGDFFALAAGDRGFDPAEAGRRFHAILLDVDHSPTHVLNPAHAPFYTVDGLRRMARYLRPGGVFGLWSDDPPDPAFLAVLAGAFTSPAAEVVTFANPLTRGESRNTIYLATRPAP